MRALVKYLRIRLRFRAELRSEDVADQIAAIYVEKTKY